MRSSDNVEKWTRRTAKENTAFIYALTSAFAISKKSLYLDWQQCTQSVTLSQMLCLQCRFIVAKEMYSSSRK